MTDGLRRHMPTILAVSLAGVATGALALAGVRGGAQDMVVDQFETLVFIVPCAIMLVCSALVTLTASEIGRMLYLVVVGICLAAGVVAMIVTSAWMSEPALAQTLLANSGEGAQVVPPVQSPIIVLRDIAAFFVVPTVGCIAGAWIGSRLHPVTSDGSGKAAAGKGGKGRSRRG